MTEPRFSAPTGVSDWDLDAFLWGHWHGGRGRKQAPQAAADHCPRSAGAPSLPLRRGVRLRARTDGTDLVEVTLLSPSLFANFSDPERSRGAYPALESFLADVTEILRKEVDELVRLGCEYIQLYEARQAPATPATDRD